VRPGLALLPLLLLAPASGCAKEPPAPPAPPRGKAEELADRADEREAMVRDQIEERGVRSPGVLAALRAVPRHRFVPEAQRRHAYEDRPLPIGLDQTISQPYVVASMTEELGIGEGMKVLEIGTGSGYQAAVLARLTPAVFTIEIKEPLAAHARETLDALGFARVKSLCGDGYYGWPEEAPFDAILVTAAVPHVPPPLVRQLKPGGRLILPVGPPFGTQDLVLVTKGEDGTVRTKSLYAVRFVPLTGSLGARGETPGD
jgi:protein-L-isoaspartate(D-aspartate) O-methyltransferase